MDRRDFTRTVMAGGILGAALGSAPSAFGNVDHDRGKEFGSFGRVALRLAVGRVVISWLLIASSGRFIGIDLRQEVPEFREGGGGGTIPLFGGLLRQPLSARFANAELVASVVLLSNMLFLLPVAAGLGRLNSIAIAHRDLGWEPTEHPSEVRMKALPAVGELGRLPVIGHAFRSRSTKRNLLVVIRPSLTDPAVES